MNPEFEKNVIEDLEKSGFSSELHSIRTFISNNWNCTGFANFYDLDQDLITGVDLRAWKEQEFDLNKQVSYGFHFILKLRLKSLKNLGYCSRNIENTFTMTVLTT